MHNEAVRISKQSVGGNNFRAITNAAGIPENHKLVHLCLCLWAHVVDLAGDGVKMISKIIANITLLFNSSTPW